MVTAEALSVLRGEPLLPRRRKKGGGPDKQKDPNWKKRRPGRSDRPWERDGDPTWTGKARKMDGSAEAAAARRRNGL